MDIEKIKQFIRDNNDNEIEEYVEKNEKLIKLSTHINGTRF